LNSLLLINKKLILYFSIILFTVFLLFSFFKYFLTFERDNNLEMNLVTNVDVSEPKFSINNSNQKIFVTAQEGNFLDNENILLNKKVLFESNKFTIETEKVIFNRKNQSAISKSMSVFKSNKTKISSEGFNIYDKGNKIIFLGKSKVVLK